MRTIIFISGFMVPKWLAKSRFVWNDSLWKYYRRIYLPSKTPLSDSMVDRELDKLCHLVNLFPDAILAGHSLGAWWAANLACSPNANISKLVFWTPLGDTTDYPIFNATKRHYPPRKTPNPNLIGPHKALTFEGKYDFIVPPKDHSHCLNQHFKGMSYHLKGGHFYQSNHKAGLLFMKDWIGLE
jgi:pimeloyl-ACP methyl ester carboxylesterase